MMAEPLLNYHPLRNDATTTIASADLERFIRACGHAPRIVAVSEPVL
jgi:Ala-tRNA(Pro) deacylase